MSPEVSIFVLLGPGARELERFQELLRSLNTVDPAFVRSSRLVVINDNDADVASTHGHALAWFCESVVLPNPCRLERRGFLTYDRIAAGVLAALGAIAKMPSARFVMKLDTDALACRPFRDRIESHFAARPRAGMIGTFRRDPDGALRNTESWWAHQIRRTSGWIPSGAVRFALVQRDRSPAKFVSRWSRRLRILRAAVANGYELGEHVLGGACALSAEAIRRLDGAAMLKDPFLFENTRMSDDVAVSLLVRAAGLELDECNRAGEPFGVWYQNPTIPFSELIARGYGLVHSVKCATEVEEHAMRAQFWSALGAAIPAPKAPAA